MLIRFNSAIMNQMAMKAATKDKPAAIAPYCSEAAPPVS
jgi:hypothetical protein